MALRRYDFITGIETDTLPNAGAVDSSQIYLTGVNYTILDDDNYGTILVNDTTADRTITLPTAADNDSRRVLIMHIAAQSGKVVVDAEGSEAINGLLNINLYNKFDSVYLQCDGSQWVIIDQYPIDKKHLLTADYTVNDDFTYESFIFTDTTAQRTLTLPTAADNVNRKLFVMKTTSNANKVIVDGEGAETINGVATYDLLQQYDFVVVQSIGSSWVVVGQGAGGNVRLYDSDASDYIQIQAPTAVTTYTISMPGTTPTANQFLRAGQSTPTLLEWASSPASSSLLKWSNHESALAPVEDIEFGLSVAKYSVGSSQEKWCVFRVPSGYISGTQIKLRVGIYTSTANAGKNIEFTLTSYLVVAGTNAINSTTNSSSSVVEYAAYATAYIPRFFEFEITDSSGQINAVSVSAGNIIRMKLSRTAASSNDDSAEARALIDYSEPVYS